MVVQMVIQMMIQMMVQMCRIGNVVRYPSGWMFKVCMWHRVHVQVLKMMMIDQVMVQVVWIVDDFIVHHLRMERIARNVNMLPVKTKVKHEPLAWTI